MVENASEYVSYRYFPENQEPSGVISVRKNDKSIAARTIASNDEFKWYFFKMLKRINQYIDAKDYESKGKIVLYEAIWPIWRLSQCIMKDIWEG